MFYTLKIIHLNNLKTFTYMKCIFTNQELCVNESQTEGKRQISKIIYSQHIFSPPPLKDSFCFHSESLQ